MTEEEKARFEVIAGQLALVEIVRLLIISTTWSDDRATFKKRLAAFEETAVDGINSRDPWPQAPKEWNDFAKDAASAWVTRIVASITHSSDHEGGID